MTKEQLVARKADLQKNFDAMVANCNALQGAIQDCDFWLNQIAAEEQKAVDAKIAAAQADAGKQ